MCCRFNRLLNVLDIVDRLHHALTGVYINIDNTTKTSNGSSQMLPLNMVAFYSFSHLTGTVGLMNRCV